MIFLKLKNLIFSPKQVILMMKMKISDKKLVPKTAEQIEDETQEDSKYFLEIAVEFKRVDFKVFEDKEGKEIMDLFDQIKENEKPVDPEIKDLFIDDNNLLENDDITDEDKNFIVDLIDKTNFS